MKIGISEICSYLRMAGMALLAAGLIGCGGGGDSDGGPNIPTASNAAITPPPTTSVTIATGAGTDTTNKTIAAAAFQTVDGGGLPTTGNLVGVFSVGAKPTVTETTRLTIAEIVRRHAEKIKDHKGSASVTGAQIVNTIPCFVSGTYTLVFDDMNGNASEIFVNCDQGGVIFHGTISSTGVSADFTPGATEGSTYTAFVAATITIDLSITSTFTNPVTVLVSQGSFNFRVDFSGTMVIGASGLEPGFPTHIKTHITGTSLLGSDGTNSEKLSNFDLTVIDDDFTGTIVDSHYTYANSASVINGAVTVNTTTPIHYASGAFHPDVGVIEITSSISPGKIKVTILPSDAGVRVDVYANAANASPTDTYTLTWAQFELLI